MGCHCIKIINEKYDDVCLDTNILDNRVGIRLFRIGSNKPETRANKPKVVVANYCPFCGDEYDPID